MMLPSFFVLVILGYAVSVVSGLITLNDVRILTNITNDCTKEIVDAGMPLVSQPTFGPLHLPDGDVDEVEDVSKSWDIVVHTCY